MAIATSISHSPPAPASGSSRSAAPSSSPPTLWAAPSSSSSSSASASPLLSASASSISLTSLSSTSSRFLPHLGKASSATNTRQDAEGRQLMDIDVAPTTPVSTSQTPKPPRRLLPQPIEESVRSSRRRGGNEAGREEKATSAEEASSAPRKFAPQPIETTARSSRRRFVPQPVETTVWSSRSSNTKKEEQTVAGGKDTDSASAPAKQPPTPRRRFAPVPIESSTRSSKDKWDDTDSRNRKRRKDGEAGEGAADSEQTEHHRDSSTSQPSPARGIRKFSPVLLETAKGSYRHSTIQLSPRRTVPESATATPTSASKVEDDQFPAATGESRFSAAALARRNRELHRQHSFAVPDLPPIESDSGDESEAPSITNSRSSAESEAHNLAKLSHKPKRPSQPVRPSIKPEPGDSYVDYIIKLAAKTATDRELQEQAMAAYINERPHERIAHYGFDEDDDTTAAVAAGGGGGGGSVRIGTLSGEKGVDVRTFRRSSQDEHDLEMQNMRNHHQKLEQMKREFKQDVAGASRFSAAALATRHHLQEKEREKKGKKNKKVKAGAAGEDDDFAKMKKAASPPMLGGDLAFPFTISPKMTRCDTDQVPRPRSYESDDDEAGASGGGGGGGGGGGDTGVWSKGKAGCGGVWNATVTVRQPAQTEGLWMGLCQSNDGDELGLAATRSHSGIQTPAAWETANPFESATPSRRTGNLSPGCRVGPKLWEAANYVRPPPVPLLSPPPDRMVDDDQFTSSIDSKLRLEKQIEDEFPDTFITQIYNYLSLGYPCLAWAFDEELSKISRISVEELRKDDGLVDARGYVGVPEGTSDWHVNGVAQGESKITCRRWEALRLYVREWARQSPSFRETADGRGNIVDPGTKRANGWGGNVAIRKGSWGH